MDMTKGQGAQAEEMTLSALLKMLELSKFLTVETMCEQYLASHAEEGMAYLIMYAAKVKSATLHKFQKGDSVNCDFQETFPLYIEHRQLLETFFHHGEHIQVENALHYMKAYLLDAMKVWETAQELPSSKEDFCDFAWMILNTMYSYDKSDFADLSLAFGKHLLAKRAFEEAKEFFENAKAQGADKAECLLHILYATMKITSESEFITCKNFSMNMPEYINLIVAIGDDDTLLQKVTTLAEENVKARVSIPKQPKKQKNKVPRTRIKKKMSIVEATFTWLMSKTCARDLVVTVSEDGKYAVVSGYKGKASKLIIPKKYKGIPIKKIGKSAFLDCTELKEIVFLDGVTYIEADFSNCTNLTSIHIPSSVQKVDSSAFRGCSKLQTVTFGENSQLSSIGYQAFKNCTSLTSITIPSSVLKVDNFAFYNCSNLKTVTFGANSQLSSIGTFAFSNCTSLTSITIPSSVQEVDSYAFSGCSNLQTVTFGENSQLSSIGSSAFSSCTSLTSITIPDSVTSIGSSAFSSCTSLTSVTISDGVTSIASHAFYSCTNLTSITIPEGVTSIGACAFSNCYSLTSVTIPDSVTSIGGGAFVGCTSLTSIYVGVGNKNYTSMDGNLYTKDGKTLIQYAIRKQNTSFTIPDSVTSIGDGAFVGCASLTSIYVGVGNKNYTSIAGNLYTKDGKTLIQYAIGKKNTSFTIPDGVTSIGDWAFRYCTSLTSITIPDSVTSIGGGAFFYCTSLTSITIPESVTSIGYHAFSGCDNLIQRENGVFYVDNWVIDCDTYLTLVALREGTKGIANSAFSDCDSLTSVTIPEGVTSIDSYAFLNCTSLTSIKYRGTQAQWYSITKGSYWDYDTGNYTIVYNYIYE